MLYILTNVEVWGVLSEISITNNSLVSSQDINLTILRIFEFWYFRSFTNIYPITIFLTIINANIRLWVDMLHFIWTCCDLIVFYVFYAIDLLENSFHVIILLFLMYTVKSCILNPGAIYYTFTGLRNLQY